MFNVFGIVVANDFRIVVAMSWKCQKRLLKQHVMIRDVGTDSRCW